MYFSGLIPVPDSVTPVAVSFPDCVPRHWAPSPCPRHWFPTWTLPQTVCPPTLGPPLDCVYSPLGRSRHSFPVAVSSPRQCPLTLGPALDTGSHPGPCLRCCFPPGSCPLTMPQTVDCVHSPMALSQTVFPLLLCPPQYSVPDPRPCLPAPDTGSHPGPCPSLCPPSPDPVPDTCFPCCWVLRQTVSPNPIPDSMSPRDHPSSFSLVAPFLHRTLGQLQAGPRHVILGCCWRVYRRGPSKH